MTWSTCSAGFPQKISRRYPVRQNAASRTHHGIPAPSTSRSHQRAKRTTIHTQNLREFEMAPRGQRYLHQKFFTKNPSSDTAVTVTIDIQRVISPLKPVATA